MKSAGFRAVFRNGHFDPLEPVSLPEGREVVFELPPPTTNEQSSQDPRQDEIFEILSRRYASGQSDIAARHNEHQP